MRSLTGKCSHLKLDLIESACLLILFLINKLSALIHFSSTARIWALTKQKGLLNKYVLQGTLDKYFDVKRLKNVTFLPWLSSFCTAASGWFEFSRWVECMEMKSKSQMGDDYGGHISRGCKARRATYDESKEGRLGNSLSLSFTSVIGFYFCIVCSSKSKESMNVTYESWHHRY